MGMRTYLGDAVYAEFDGYQIKLYTSNGIVNTNVIYLEPEVYTALLRFVDHISKGNEPCA